MHYLQCCENVLHANTAPGKFLKLHYLNHGRPWNLLNLRNTTAQILRSLCRDVGVWVCIWVCVCGVYVDTIKRRLLIAMTWNLA